MVGTIDISTVNACGLDSETQENTNIYACSNEFLKEGSLNFIY